MPKRRFPDDQPGGYDPLAETAARFAVEPLRLRPSAEIGLEDNTGGPGGPSTPRPKAEMTADEIIDFLKDFTRSPPEADPGYVYHTSPRDRALDIREEGSINLFDPSHGTDQESWPDGSVDLRSYWGKSPGHVVPFSQDDPTLWRAQKDQRFKDERGTGDLYATEPVSGLEYLGEGGGWHRAGPRQEPVPAAPATRDDLAKAMPQDSRWNIVPDDPNQMSVYLGKQKDPEQWHKAGGGNKMDTPFSELTYKTEPTGGAPLPPQKTLTPEEMQGSVGMALLGDKTRSGETLTQVNGIDLTNPQKLEGGYRYGDEFPGEIWASDQEPIRRLMEEVHAASDDGKKRVLGLPVAQGAEGGDFARMMTGPTLDLMRQAELTPEAMILLDRMMTAKLTNKKTGRTRWPGAEEVLKSDDWMNSASGSDRAQLAKMMTQKVNQNERVPIAALRKAITAPDLLNRPALTTGLNVGEFDLGKGPITSGRRHGTYTTGVAGTSLGRVGELPYDWMFQKHAAENLVGKDAAQAQRTVMTQYPVQDFNQEWLDNLMARRAEFERNRR